MKACKRRAKAGARMDQSRLLKAHQRWNKKSENEVVRGRNVEVDTSEDECGGQRGGILR